MKTLKERKLLITKDQYEDKAASTHKMQAPPYTEEEYWKKKETRPASPAGGSKELTLEEILAEIKKHEGK